MTADPLKRRCLHCPNSTTNADRICASCDFHISRAHTPIPDDYGLGAGDWVPGVRGVLRWVAAEPVRHPRVMALPRTCLDCDEPMSHKALRCAPHAAAADRASKRLHARRSRGQKEDAA